MVRIIIGALLVFLFIVSAITGLATEESKTDLVAGLVGSVAVFLLPGVLLIYFGRRASKRKAGQLTSSVDKVIEPKKAEMSQVASGETTDDNKGKMLFGVGWRGILISMVIWIPTFVFIMVKAGVHSTAEVGLFPNFIAFIVFFDTAGAIEKSLRARKEKRTRIIIITFKERMKKFGFYLLLAFLCSLIGGQTQQSNKGLSELMILPFFFFVLRSLYQLIAAVVAKFKGASGQANTS